MNKQAITLQRILQLSDYVKLSIHNDKVKHHHPLKLELSKSSRRILLTLKQNGPLNQRNISKILRVSPQAISEAVKKLEADNLISKDNSNKNETLILLTAKGEEKADTFIGILENHATKLFEDFSDDELNRFISFVEKLISQGEDNV